MSRSYDACPLGKEKYSCILGFEPPENRRKIKLYTGCNGLISKEFAVVA